MTLRGFLPSRYRQDMQESAPNSTSALNPGGSTSTLPGLPQPHHFLGHWALQTFKGREIRGLPDRALESLYNYDHVCVDPSLILETQHTTYLLDANIDLTGRLINATPANCYVFPTEAVGVLFF